MDPSALEIILHAGYRFPRLSLQYGNFIITYTWEGTLIVRSAVIHIQIRIKRQINAGNCLRLLQRCLQPLRKRQAHIRSPHIGVFPYNAVHTADNLLRRVALFQFICTGRCQRGL